MQVYQDTMSIFWWLGHPNIFITMTCNSKWNKITRVLKLIPEQALDNKPDVISRFFLDEATLAAAQCHEEVFFW